MRCFEFFLECQMLVRPGIFEFEKVSKIIIFLQIWLNFGWKNAFSGCTTMLHRITFILHLMRSALWIQFLNPSLSAVPKSRNFVTSYFWSHSQSRFLTTRHDNIHLLNLVFVLWTKYAYIISSLLFVCCYKANHSTSINTVLPWIIAGVIIN